MLKWILGIAGGLVWCALVFVISLYVTFPSAAVVERAQYEVQKGSSGAYALQASSASPWWTGVSLADVKLMTVDKGSGEGSLVLEADSVSASTSLFSLLGSNLPLHAVVDLGDSNMVVDAELDRSVNPPKVKRIEGQAGALTVSGLGALLAPYGVTLTGTGTVAVDVDLELGDDVKDHDGRISAKGKKLEVTVAMPDPLSGEGEFVLGPIAVSNLDMVFDIRNGKASVKKGLLRTDVADVTLAGTLTLNRKLTRSRLRGDLVVGQLGGQLAAFESFMKNAKQDDDQYHYRLSCTLDRFNAKCLQPERQRSSGTNRSPVQLDSGAGADAGKSAEELREERRAKREERLAERRARIASERQPERPDPRDEEIIDDEDDEELDDEELIDEPPELLVDPSVLRRPDQDLLPAAPGGAAVPFPIDAVPGEVPQFE